MIETPKRCPYLRAETDRHVCGASLSGMSPAFSDLKSYCSTEDHYLCPILVAHALRDGWRKTSRRRGVERMAG